MFETKPKNKDFKTSVRLAGVAAIGAKVRCPNEKLGKLQEFRESYTCRKPRTSAALKHRHH
jgi:hypothetical protein